MARMALAAMDSEPVELPLDYLQGHKDGLEWAAQLAEANHPETGDWLYDDPIELAKAIRKGPDMPPAQPAADSEPVIVVGDDGGDALSYRRLIQSFEPGTKLYRHAQPAPAAPVAYSDFEEFWSAYIHPLAQDDELKDFAWDIWNACRAAILQHQPQNAPQNIPEIISGWIPVSERMPESNGVYFGWDGKRVLEVYCFFGGFSANQFIHGEITHWMPLPAAPQEDINALIPLVSRNEQEGK
ncbi:TPA: DUF551 domain-containing protein [Klebsiella pneumoniae]|nr:DUF551 domain-containing protein [Klebsiella pneumoniae]HBS2692902.1 DUF551 domain-containing protein [Klebsiella pneumoniae]HBS2698602.1 DUF551 domain-containing protein [Klebsiella pneumoniae]